MKKATILRYAVYIYLFSILYDAIFRKWLLPSMSPLIMMIKQIVAIFIFFYGLSFLSKNKGWEMASILLGFFVFLTSLLFGHGSVMVAVWGCMPYWFGIPVCFIIGKVLINKDLFMIGKIIVYTSILNSILIIIQFTLPTSHWINYKGAVVAENIADKTTVELAGMFRPCGIFITSAHNSLFILLALSYILYFMMIQKEIMKSIVLYFSLILFCISCICTASRTNIFYCIGLFSFISYYYLSKDKLWSYFKKTIVFSIFIIIFSSISFIQNAFENISNRFDNASEVQYKNKSTLEGTILDLYNRSIGYNLKALFAPETMDGQAVPFWGFGQGLSTQVGGRLIKTNQGKSGFALAEWDGLRIMCESGFLLGWLILFVRLGYTFRFLPDLARYKNRNDYLSIILYPSFLVSFYLLNTWGNSFLANFAFFVAGLFLASVRINRYNKLCKM